MKRAVIVGRSGRLARALMQAPWPDDWMVEARGRGEGALGLDITDPAACAALFQAPPPRLVINASAYTAVDKAEEETAAAFALNGEAPARLAELCRGHGSVFVHVSTDYVFDGSGVRPWREDDPTNPLNAYGRSKEAGEQGVLGSGACCAVVRTSWLYDGRGGDFVSTMRRLALEKTQMRVVDDQIGAPTLAEDLAAILVSLGVRMADTGEALGLVHAANAGEGSWADVAEAVFARTQATHGRRPTLERITTADWPTPAPRPLNSRLDCSKLAALTGAMRPWREALSATLTALDQETQQKETRS